MAVERQFLVKLIADPSALIRDFQTVRGEAEKTFGIANAKVQSLLPGFKILTTAAAGVFTGLVAGAGLAVKAAVESQAEQNRLRQILLTTGKATEDQVEALNGQADALERVGVVAGGNITVLQSQLATFDLQATTISKLTPAILDYVVAEKGATATTEDFKSMTNGLAQALNGQFGALTRAGFVLDDNTKALISNGTEAERAAAIVDVLSSTYGGFNEALRETTEGQLIAFRNSVDQLKTDLGKALLPAFDAIVRVLATFADFAARNSTAVGALAGVLGALSGTVLLLAGYLKVAAFQKRLMNDEFIKGILTMRNSEGQMTKTGTAVQALGKGFAVLAAAQGVFSVLNEITSAGKNVETQFNKLVIAVNGFKQVGTDSPKAVVEEFSKMGRVIQDQFRLKDVFQEFGRDFQFVAGGVKVNIESMDEAFDKLLKTDPVQASGVIDSLRAQLAVTEPGTRAYIDLTDALARYEAQAKLSAHAQRILNGEQAASPVFKMTAGLNAIARQHKFESEARLGSVGALEKYNAEIRKGLSGVGSSISLTDKLAEAKDKLKSSTSSVASAQISERNSGESLERADKSLMKATADVTAAKERLRIAIQGFGKDSREGVNASRSLASAQRQLTRANQGVSDAQNKVLEAERKLADLRRRAADPNEITNAEFGLEKSKLDVEEATLRIQEAEEDLAKTLKDPDASPIEKRRAELKLVSAKFGLRDAIISQGASEAELIAIRNTGATSEELADAERELSDAKLAVQDAIDNQTSSLQALNEEQENYRKVTEGIREDDEEFIELSKEVVAAEEAQTDAARSLRDAREQAAAATDTLRKAEEELRSSRKELRLARGGAPGRAFGGPVSRGGAYMVGERGPELFVPTGSGNIIPNNNLGGGGTTVQVVVNAGMGTSGTQVGQEIVDVLRAYTRVSGPLSQYVAV